MIAASSKSRLSAALAVGAALMLTAAAGVPVIDEQSRFLADLAEDGVLGKAQDTKAPVAPSGDRLSARRNGPDRAMAPPSAPTAPGEISYHVASAVAPVPEAVKDNIRQALDRAFSTRIDTLKAAEAKLRAAAAAEYMSIPDVHAALEHAVTLRETALSQALAALNDVELKLSAPGALQPVMAALKAQSGHLELETEGLERALEILAQDRKTACPDRG